MLTGRHLIQPDDLSVSEIEEICSLAEQIIVDPKSFQDVCRGKILATLFLSRALEQGSALRRPCCDLAVR